jgi:hypothetical protein
MASRRHYQPEPAERRQEQNCAADFVFGVEVSNGGEEEPSVGREPGVEAASCGRFQPGVEPTAAGGVGV